MARPVYLRASAALQRLGVVGGGRIVPIGIRNNSVRGNPNYDPPCLSHHPTKQLQWWEPTIAIFFGFRKLITPMCGVLLLRAKVVGDERPLGHHRNLSSRRSFGSLGELDRFRVSNPRNQARRPSH